MTRLSLLFLALQFLACCRAACTDTRLTIRTDGYPKETRWELKRNGKVAWSADYKGGNRCRRERHCASRGSGVCGSDKVCESAEKNTEYESNKCIQNAKYELTIFDTHGDGVCCQTGDGYYKLETKHGQEWKTLLHGGKFIKSETQTVWIGPRKGQRIVNKMSWWDKSWLAAHNTRRLDYHVDQWDKEYVPLKWSPALKERAQEYAYVSAQDCLNGIQAKHGDASLEYGENVLGNSGNSGGTWAAFKSANGYLKQFVDRESGWEYPRNGHESMAMWRATQYVGCANATVTWDKTPGKSHTCHRVVCRFAKSGNCLGGGLHNNWELAAMQDNTQCGPMCPPEGCFHANELPEPDTPFPGNDERLPTPQPMP